MEQATTILVTNQPKQNIIQAVRKYGLHLFNFIRGRVNTDEDAEDILQDVWFQFAKMLNSGPIEQTSAWLFRVARNRIVDYYRKPEQILMDDEVYFEEDADEFDFKEVLIAKNPSPQEEQLRNLFWAQLFHALNELAEEQRQVFIWNELEEIPFREISQRTGEKVNTLISRKRYAVLHLRKRLAEFYKEFIEQ